MGSKRVKQTPRQGEMVRRFQNTQRVKRVPEGRDGENGLKRADGAKGLSRVEGNAGVTRAEGDLEGRDGEYDFRRAGGGER